MKLLAPLWALGKVQGFTDMGDLAAVGPALAPDEDYFLLGPFAFFTWAGWTNAELADAMAAAAQHVANVAVALPPPAPPSGIRSWLDEADDLPELVPFVPVHDRRCRKCQNKSLRIIDTDPDRPWYAFCKLCGQESAI